MKNEIKWKKGKKFGKHLLQNTGRCQRDVTSYSFTHKRFLINIVWTFTCHYTL